MNWHVLTEHLSQAVGCGTMLLFAIEVLGKTTCYTISELRKAWKGIRE